MIRLTPFFIALFIASVGMAQVPGQDPAAEVIVKTCPDKYDVLALSPNPVRSMHSLTCELPGEAVEGELLVYAMNGAQIRRIPVSAHSAQVGLRALRPGTYSYRLKTTDGNTCPRKLSVVR